MLYYFGRLWMKVVFVQICFEKSTRKPVRLPTCDKWQKPTLKFSVKSPEILQAAGKPGKPWGKTRCFQKTSGRLIAATHPKIGQFLSKSCKSRRWLNGLKEHFEQCNIWRKKAVRICVKKSLHYAASGTCRKTLQKRIG